jgi:hypothetical protein
VHALNQGLPVGDKRTILNTNCGNAYENLKLRQKWKWKINASKQTNKSRNSSPEENKSLYVMQYLLTISAIYGMKVQS